MDDSRWQRLRRKWMDEGLDVGTGATDGEIAEFERRHGVMLPPSMKSYFMEANGIGEYQMDAWNYTFWPLHRIRRVEDELTDNPDRWEYPGCYLFCDWGLWCWGYAIRLDPRNSNEGPVFFVAGDMPPGGIIAESFDDFMERYERDPDSLCRDLPRRGAEKQHGT